MKRILHLTLKKKWFDMIARGKKNVEYREFKRHWIGRFFDVDDRLRQFDEVHFRNGYANNAPFMRVKCLGVRIAYSEHYGKKSFCIDLGEVLEVINWGGGE